MFNLWGEKLLQNESLTLQWKLTLERVQQSCERDNHNTNDMEWSLCYMVSWLNLVIMVIRFLLSILRGEA